MVAGTDMFLLKDEREGISDAFDDLEAYTSSFCVEADDAD